MLQVRERPPLRLSVNIETPSGVHQRLGADDPDAANKPDGLSFGTSMPGGFADCSWTLARDPRRDWPDMEELADVKVRGPGSAVAYEGRLEKLPDQGGSQAQLSPQCVGYQSALDDDSTASMICVDRDLTRWGDVAVARQIALVAGSIQLQASQVATDPTNNTPALVQSITDSWVAPFVPLGESWYDAGPGNLIAKVYYSLNDPLQGAGFVDEVFLASDASASTVEGSGAIASGTAGYLAPATAYRFALIEHEFSSGAGGGAQGAIYNAYWQNLAVYGDHGLTLQGTDPGGLLASDVAAHAVGKWAPDLAFTTGSSGTIQPSTFIIPQLAFRDPTTVSAIIKQIVQYELLDWAVWEGPTYYQNPRGESAKTRNWRARIGPAQLQETGPDVSRIFNGVVVTYTNADGTTGVVGPTDDARLLDTDASNPANQAGIKRYAIVQVGTTTLDGAVQIGQIFLQVQNITDTSGQASLVGHVQDDKGVWWPAWMVRAGDTITFTDARDTRARRVVSTSYEHSSKTNTLQLDQPPDVMSAYLAEISEAVAPLGLS